MISPDSYERYATIAPYRNTFYLSFKNTTVLRWAAKLTNGKNCHTLTLTFWRKVECVGDPLGCLPSTNGQTVYFSKKEDAENALAVFIKALEHKQIIK